MSDFERLKQLAVQKKVSLQGNGELFSIEDGQNRDVITEGGESMAQEQIPAGFNAAKLLQLRANAQGLEDNTNSKVQVENSGTGDSVNGFISIEQARNYFRVTPSQINGGQGSPTLEALDIAHALGESGDVIADRAAALGYERIRRANGGEWTSEELEAAQDSPERQQSREEAARRRRLAELDGLLERLED